MAFDPTPLDLMPGLGDHMVQGLPKLHIFNRLLGGGTPALGFPAMDPLGDALANVFTVQVQRHLARPFEGLQALDHSGQLHAVVGGAQFAAKQLVHMLARLQTHPPAPRTRIAFTGPIGIDFNVIQQMSFEAAEQPIEVSDRAAGTVEAAGDRTARHWRAPSQRPAGTLLVAKIRYTPPRMGHQR